MFFEHGKEICFSMHTFSISDIRAKAFLSGFLRKVDRALYPAYRS